MPRAIIDEFTELKIHRERKRQLRKVARGLCSWGGCNEPLAGKWRCHLHMLRITVKASDANVKGRMQRTKKHLMELMKGD